MYRGLVNEGITITCGAIEGTRIGGGLIGLEGEFSPIILYATCIKHVSAGCIIMFPSFPGLRRSLSSISSDLYSFRIGGSFARPFRLVNHF